MQCQLDQICDAVMINLLLFFILLTNFAILDEYESSDYVQLFNSRSIRFDKLEDRTFIVFCNET